MPKKLLLVLSLTTALQLNCASTTTNGLAEELLGLTQSGGTSAAPIDQRYGVSDLSAVGNHRSAGGLEDSNFAHIDYLKNCSAKRTRQDWECERKQMSWPQYIMRTLNDSFHYLFGDKKIPAPQGITPASAPGDDDSLALGETGGTKAGSALSSLLGVGFDILKGMTFSSEIVYDQGSINACTANSLGFIIRYWSVKNSDQPANFTLTNLQLLSPSRLHHYYNSRAIAGTLTANIDKAAINLGLIGAPVSAERALLSLDRYGTCPESITTVNVTVKSTLVNDVALEVKDLMGVSIADSSQNSFTLQVGGMGYSVPNVTGQIKPSLDSYLFSCNSGLTSSDPTLKNYQLVAQNIRYTYLGNSTNQYTDVVEKFKSELSTSLKKNGYPIFWGARVYSAFGAPKSIFIPMPTDKIDGVNQTLLGGHAMVIVGWGNYNTALPSTSYFKVLNSWGPSWGDGGFCYFPEEYITGQTFVGNSDKTVKTNAGTTASTLPNTVSAYSVYLPAPPK